MISIHHYLGLLHFPVTKIPSGVTRFRWKNYFTYKHIGSVWIELIVTVRHQDPKAHTDLEPRPIQALGPGPYRPWAQAQRKGPVTLRPSWNCLTGKTSFGFWIPRGDRLNFPGQAYEPCPGKPWYARETELPNIINQAGTKFQGHKCCTALSPKHPL